MKTKIKDNYLISFIAITIGAFLGSIALNTLLLPNTILDGGVMGVSMIISKLSGFSLSILMLLLNAPFIYIGYKHLGKGFLIRAIYSMIIYSILIKLTEGFEPITEEMLLATVFGGALLGIGVGIVIRFGGCVDGTESVALVLSRKINLSVGQIVLLFNLIIYSVAGILFGLDRGLYSILTYFITSKVIDLVSTGLEQTKQAFIITEKGTELSKVIYKTLGRTVTTIKGKGLISGDKEVLYCVLTRIEIYELKKIVNSMDEIINMKILVFDSGIGGLPIANSIHNKIPNIDIIYYQDTINNPYGNKTDEELKNITTNIVNYAKDNNINFIVIACNTATTRCMKYLKETYPDITFVGTVPAIKVALDNNYKNILVIGTEPTIKSSRLQEIINDNKKDNQNIYLKSLNGLANAIEINNEEKIDEILNTELKEYLDKEIDSIVLGCTHYYYIKDKLKNYFKDIDILDGNDGVVNQVERLLQDKIDKNYNGKLEILVNK